MSTELQPFEQRFPEAAKRGIDEPTWNALCNSVFPGAKDESVLMVWDYCQAQKLDPLKKPVHIVPMSVKDANTGNNNFRDVVMPGIGLYRITADRSGNYAGADEPEFGPDITHVFTGKNGQKVEITYPQWCAFTVYKIVDGHIVPFKAREFWLENYATQSRDVDAPNAMWQKRPYGQIAKCAEAQALRRGWPEIGSQPTAEEMEGKSLSPEDMNAIPGKARQEPAEPEPLPEYPAESFETNLPKWRDAVEAGKTSPDGIIGMISSKYTLTDEQARQIRALGGEETEQAETE